MIFILVIGFVLGLNLRLQISKINDLPLHMTLIKACVMVHYCDSSQT